MPADKPTELSRINLKTWTRQPVPMISEHPAHSTPLRTWLWRYTREDTHYGDVIMGAIASKLTRLASVYSTVYSGAGQRKHQSSASLAFVRGIHRGPVNSPHKWPVPRKMFPFDDVIMSMKVIEYTEWRLGFAICIRRSLPICWHHGAWKYLTASSISWKMK